jgi:hypothetical protein
MTMEASTKEAADSRQVSACSMASLKAPAPGLVVEEAMRADWSIIISGAIRVHRTACLPGCGGRAGAGRPDRRRAFRFHGYGYSRPSFQHLLQAFYTHYATISTRASATVALVRNCLSSQVRLTQKPGITLERMISSFCPNSRSRLSWRP